MPREGEEARSVKASGRRFLEIRGLLRGWMVLYYNAMPGVMIVHSSVFLKQHATDGKDGSLTCNSIEVRTVRNWTNCVRLVVPNPGSQPTASSDRSESKNNSPRHGSLDQNTLEGTHLSKQFRTREIELVAIRRDRELSSYSDLFGNANAGAVMDRIKGLVQCTLQDN